MPPDAYKNIDLCSHASRYKVRRFDYQFRLSAYIPYSHNKVSSGLNSSLLLLTFGRKLPGCLSGASEKPPPALGKLGKTAKASGDGGSLIRLFYMDETNETASNQSRSRPVISLSPCQRCCRPCGHRCPGQAVQPAQCPEDYSMPG